MALQKATLPLPPTWHVEFETVGVTGTNGKSTTTTYVAAALATLSSPVACVTTLGFFVGDEQLAIAGSHAAFLQTLATARTRGARHAAIELTSEALALGFIRAWPCRVGVFTNLTRDHLDRHGSAEHYLASKAQLFVHLPKDGKAVLNGCDPASALLAEIVPQGVEVLYYGARTRSEPVTALDLQATSIDVSWSGTRLSLAASSQVGSVPSEFTIRSIGEVFAENALAALTAAIAIGVPADLAAARIGAAPTLPGRFEVVRTHPHVVVDYAHTPDALERTIACARRLCAGRLSVVFGAGGERDQPKRPLMGQAAHGADSIILTSDNPRSEDPELIAEAIRDGLTGHAQVEFIVDRAEAIRTAVRRAAHDDVVVVAGKGHETEQHVAGQIRQFSDREVARKA